MCPDADQRSHRDINNRTENAHTPTRRKEKCLIKFKSLQGIQRLLSLMVKVRNLIAIFVGRYTKPASQRREAFQAAQTLWVDATEVLVI